MYIYEPCIWGGWWVYINMYLDHMISERYFRKTKLFIAFANVSRTDGTTLSPSLNTLRTVIFDPILAFPPCHKIWKCDCWTEKQTGTTRILKLRLQYYLIKPLNARSRVFTIQQEACNNHWVHTNHFWGWGPESNTRESMWHLSWGSYARATVPRVTQQLNYNLRSIFNPFVSISLPDSCDQIKDYSYPLKDYTNFIMLGQPANLLGLPPFCSFWQLGAVQLCTWPFKWLP